MRSTSFSVRRLRGKLLGSRTTRAFRPLLEALEDRLAPANVYWNVDADGFWDVTSNWRDEFGVSRLPTPEDEVFLDRPTGAFTVTHRQGPGEAYNLQFNRSHLVLSGGSLVIYAPRSVIDSGVELHPNHSIFAGDFTFSGGLLAGALTTAGNTIWSGGTMGNWDPAFPSSLDLENTGALTMTGNAGRFRGDLYNFGIVHDGTGLGERTPSVFNRPTGVYNLLADVRPANAFWNEGTLRKSGGTGTVSFPRFYNLGGTVDLRSGNLVLDGRTPGPHEFRDQPPWTGGTFHAAAGSFLDIVGIARDRSQGFKLLGTYTGSGAGTVRILSQALALDAAGATFGFSGEPLEFQGTEILTGAAGLNNTGGIKLVTNSTVTLSGVLNNSGTITHASPGDLQLAFGGVDATLNNLVGGVYDIQGDADFTHGTFNNAGTLRKSAGAGTTIVQPRNFSNQGGTIDVQSGRVQISGPLNTTVPGWLSTGGVFNVSAGAMLDLTSTEHVVSYSGIYTGSGAGAVRVHLGVVVIGTAGATFNFSPGLFQWSGGTLAGGQAGLANVGSMSLVGSDNKFFSGLFTNAGTITHSGTGDFNLTAPGFLYSGPDGTVNNLAGGLYDVQGEARLANGVFNNAGTVRKSAGTGVVRSFNHRFNNVGGTIDVRSGTFLLQGTSGTPYPTHTGGNFVVEAGAFLDMTNAAGPQIFTGTYTGSGEGKVRITGVVNTGGAITVGPGGAAFDFPQGLLNWIEGIIDGRTAPFTNRGSLTVDVNTTVSFNPFVRLRGTLNNAGTILHVNNGIVAIDGDSGLGNLTNLAGGVYEFQGAGIVQRNSGTGPGAAVQNLGTLRTTGAGTATIDTDSPFNNVGAVEVNAGRLFVKSPVAQVSGTTLTGGTWKVQADGLLELEDHPRITTNQATVLLDGPAARFLAMRHLLTNVGSLSLANGHVMHVPVGRVARHFETGLPNTHAVAFDPTTGNLFIYQQFSATIQEFTPTGTEVLPRIPFPGGAAIAVDLDVASAPLTVGGTAVPAGTLLVVNGSAARLFGIDRNTGAVLASVSLPMPPGTIHGGSYHAGRNTIFLVDSFTVFEIDPATGTLLRSFPIQPLSSPPFGVNQGDLDVDPLTGNLLLVGHSFFAIREMTPTGQFLRDQDYQTLNVGRVKGLAVDEATRHLWLINDLGFFDELDALFTNRGSLTLGPGSALVVPGAYVQEASGSLTTHVAGSPASGQFGRITATSPVTLHGTFRVELTGGFAPTVGQQFPVITYPSSSGGFDTVTGLSAGRTTFFTVDQLATRVLLSAAGTAVDLAFGTFEAATFPATATPGQPLTVAYTGRNLSDRPAVGEWVDSVYLSQTNILDENAILLGRVRHVGGVAALSTYRESLTAPLPPLADGSYRVLVLIDSRGLVPDADRANNRGSSPATISSTIPLLALGTPFTGTIADGQDRYFRLVAPPRKDVKITATFPATRAAEVFVRYRELPDRSNFDQATSANDPQQRLLLTAPQAGSYVVLVHGREGSGPGASFTLLAEATGFEIVRVTPLRGSNTGSATVEVFGSQFTPQTTVSLRQDSGGVVPAESVQFVNANHLVARLDLTGLPTGNYRVRVDDPTGTAEAFDTFTVTAAPPGKASVFIWAPRYIVNLGQKPTINVDVKNDDDNDAPAPFIVIEAVNVVPGQQRIALMGGRADKLPSLMPPGYFNRIPLVYGVFPVFNGVTSTFTLRVSDPSQRVDWDSQKETLRPPSIPTDAWDAIWTNLRPEFGDTLADLFALLQRDADQLARLGVLLTNVEQLTAFELRKANDLPALPVPAAAVDLSFPAPGLPLVFARNYGSSIAQRFHKGRLGRGWADTFDISLANDAANGVVTIRQGHLTRVFAKNDEGIYGGGLGDFATLTEANGAFQLREQTGEVIGFRADGSLGALQDRSGNRITAGYTGNQMTSLTHSNGKALALTYNAQGRLSQVRDPAGRVATYVYDASGEHLLRVTTAAGTIDYTYTPETTGPRAHALTSVGFPSGTHFFFAYDSKGRLARQERDGGAEPVTYSYDVTSYRVRDALGNVTDIFFDDMGLTRASLDPLARVTGTNYDERGLPTTQSTADGASATFSYDAKGNPTQVLDPLGQEQTFGYEPTFGNLVSWQDPLGQPMSFAYDASGNVQSITYADGTVAERSHDAQGNLTGALNRRGQLIRYTYDANGLRTRKDLPDGSHVDYAYDARGNLLSATGTGGATVMEYDAADRMTKITYPGGRFLQFAYDAGGRRTRSTDQSGFTVNSRYDAAGRLEELTDGQSQPLVTYAYDPTGRLASETRGNSTTTSYEYDPAGQLLSLVHRAPDGTVLSRFDYTYDASGRRTSMTTLEGTTEYAYDAAGQLVLAALPGGRVIQYDYDAAGNRREVSDNGVTTVYAANELNQYVAFGATGQGFDADGNLAFSAGPAGPRSSRYDAEGRLVSIVTPEGTWAYEYDVFGNRVATVHDGVRTEYLIDPAGLGNVVAEYDGAGSLRAHYAHGLGLVSRIDVAGPAAYFEFDANGNTAQLTGPDGAVLNAYSYLPFGEPLTVNETVANPFTFVGQLGVMREGNGLDYMRNRWYDPTQGRFTQDDPIGLAGGTNFYAYVGNNPVSGLDPSGLAWTVRLTPAQQAELAQEAQALSRQLQGAQEAYVGSAKNLASEFGEATVVSNGAGTAQLTSTAETVAEAELARTTDAGAAEKLVPRLASRAATRGSALGETQLYIIAAAEIAVVSATLMSLARGLDYLYNTGDLPPCILPSKSPIGQIFELCRGPSSKYVDELLDLIFPAAQGIKDIISLTQRSPQSIDPNDIVGPGGYGADGFLRAVGTLPYVINFENAPTAGGPAQEVIITHRLDDDLDLDTFQLDDFGFGDLTIDVPGGRQFYQTRVDLRTLTTSARQDLVVDVTAELDRVTRVATWTFNTLDPETQDIPMSPFVGFLPPDRQPPEGQGFVSFTVRPRADSITGTRIDALATIVFDTNEPIDTPHWTNTLDLDPPTSRVTLLPAVTTTTSFTVSWVGNDGLGSGVATYDVFVSVDDGPSTLWQDDTTLTSATFTGSSGHTYAFFSVATDNVGHVELATTTPDSVTRVDATAPTVLDVVDVAPDPRSTPVAAVDVVFSEPIDLNTFNHNDLTLTRNGGVNLITSAVTVAPVPGTYATYRISGLTNLTDRHGAYELTVDAAMLRDLVGNFGTGSQADAWQNNVKIGTTTTLSSSSPTSTVGQEVTFTARVEASDSGRPGGIVTFKDGAAVLGTAMLDLSGQATLRTSLLGAGGHQMTAVYEGDDLFQGSTSAPLTQTVSGGVIDVTSQVTVTRGGFRYNRATRRWFQSITLTNTGSTAIQGPISLVLDDLNSIAQLFNATGYTRRRSPYLDVFVGVFVPGQSVSVTLEFDNPTNAGISYTTRVLAGSGER